MDNDSALSERDHILLGIGRHAPPGYSLRLLKLFLHLADDDRSQCIFDDKWFKSRIETAIHILQAQDDGLRRSQAPATPPSSPTKKSSKRLGIPSVRQRAHDEYPTIKNQVSFISHTTPFGKCADAEPESARGSESDGLEEFQCDMISMDLLSTLANMSLAARKHPSKASKPSRPPLPSSDGNPNQQIPTFPTNTRVTPMPQIPIHCSKTHKPLDPWPHDFAMEEKEWHGTKTLDKAWVVFRGSHPGVYTERASAMTSVSQFPKDAKYGGWKSFASADAQWELALRNRLVFRLEI